MHLMSFSLLLCAIATCIHGNLVIKPQNTIVLSGQSARFNCSTDSNTSSVDWQTGVVGYDLVSGMCISQYPKLYSGILNDKNCDLELMPSVTSIPSYYYCNDDFDWFQILLVVIDAEPTCVLNKNDNTLVCNGNYRCSEYNPPAWISCDGLGDGPVTIYQRSLVLYTLTETVFNLTTPFDPSVGRPSYNCRLNNDFTAYNTWTNHFARNIAVYEFKSQSIAPLTTTITTTTVAATTPPTTSHASPVTTTSTTSTSISTTSATTTPVAKKDMTWIAGPALAALGLLAVIIGVCVWFRQSKSSAVAAKKKIEAQSHPPYYPPPFPYPRPPPPMGFPYYPRYPRPMRPQYPRR